MTRNELRDWIGGCIEAKGFHDDGSGLADGAMWRATLVLTEVMEAVQEVKRHWGKDGYDHEALKDKVSEECADAAIRLYDLSFWLTLDLDREVAVEVVQQVGVTERFRLMNHFGKIARSVTGVYTTMEHVWLCGSDGLSRDGYFRDQDYGMENDAACDMVRALDRLELLCRDIGRDLVAAVEKKMAENMARPYRYGTPDAEPATPGVNAEWIRDAAEEDGCCVTVGHIDKVKAVADMMGAKCAPGQPFAFQPIQVIESSE